MAFHFTSKNSLSGSPSRSHKETTRSSRRESPDVLRDPTEQGFVPGSEWRTRGFPVSCNAFSSSSCPPGRRSPAQSTFSPQSMITRFCSPNAPFSRNVQSPNRLDRAAENGCQHIAVPQTSQNFRNTGFPVSGHGKVPGVYDIRAQRFQPLTWCDAVFRQHRRRVVSQLVVQCVRIGAGKTDSASLFQRQKRLLVFSSTRLCSARVSAWG